MSSILKIKDVNKNFGKISVLNDINTNIDKNEEEKSNIENNIENIQN